MYFSLTYSEYGCLVYRIAGGKARRRKERKQKKLSRNQAVYAICVPASIGERTKQKQEMKLGERENENDGKEVNKKWMM